MPLLGAGLGARDLRRTGALVADLLPSWSLAPVVEAIQAKRGVAFVVAVTVVAEPGDFQRFDNPRQLMAYLGFTPSQHSRGNTVSRSLTIVPSIIAKSMSGSSETASKIFLNTSSFTQRRNRPLGRDDPELRQMTMIFPV